MGSLLMHPFKRILVNDEKYPLKLVHYIHSNPLEVGLCEIHENWLFSSYSELTNEVATFLEKEEIISWFGDLENFKYIHTVPPEQSGISGI